MKFKDWKVSKWLLMMNCKIFITWLSWFLRQRSISEFDFWDKEDKLTLGTWVLPTTGRASFFGVFIASESLLCCIILHCYVVYHCLGIFVWCNVWEFTFYCIAFCIVLYCIVWESLLEQQWEISLTWEPRLGICPQQVISLFGQDRSSANIKTPFL